MAHSEETRQVMSEAMTDVWERPGHRESHKAALRAAARKPGAQEKRRAIRLALEADPERKGRMLASRRRTWAKKAVKQAELPLLRKIVDRAEQLHRENTLAVVVSMLRREFRRAARLAAPSGRAA